MNYLIPGNTHIESIMKAAYWDDIYKDIEKNDYTKLISILSELKELTMNLIPNRIDIHEKLNEYIDIPFLKQKFENNVFDVEDFKSLFCYWIKWIRDLGPPVNDKKIDELKEYVIKTTDEQGHMYILPFAFDQIHTHLIMINEEVFKIREKMNNIKVV
jgi:hypothetical protein